MRDARVGGSGRTDDGVRRAADDPMVTVDRLRKLRADRASGRVTHEQFVEQRHHLLDRRHRDLPYAGPERRRSGSRGDHRCEWCAATDAEVVPARLVAGGELLVDGVRLCHFCARLVSLEDRVYEVSDEPSVLVTFLHEVHRRRTVRRLQDAAGARSGRRSGDRVASHAARAVDLDLTVERLRERPIEP